MQRLRGSTKRAAFGPADAEAIRENLKAFCNRNLYEATFKILTNQTLGSNLSGSKLLIDPSVFYN